MSTGWRGWLPVTDLEMIDEVADRYGVDRATAYGYVMGFKPTPGTFEHATAELRNALIRLREVMLDMVDEWVRGKGTP